MPLWIGAAIGAASALLNEMTQAEATSRQAKQLGVQMASLDAEAGRRQQELAGKAAGISESAMLAEVSADKNEAAAVSEAQVLAAASGVAGSSVDQTTTQLQASTANLKSNIQKQQTSAMLQLEQDSSDIVYRVDQARGEVDFHKQSTAGGLSNIFLGGLRGYYL